MVDRVFISDNTFITRNANNNITFSADRYYVKNDPNGSFFLGGVTTTPVLVGRTSGEGTPSPYTNIAGFVIDHSFSRTVVNGLNVSGFNFNIPVRLFYAFFKHSPPNNCPFEILLLAST